ncbi:RNA-binding S4 domain-containing protein [Shimazuella alba]|jgi:ribosomal 50S subunit-recycling heat shock protein|uniref:RQC P-site tRNA stabilizing factor n=1 Tax=Shimazuella alba TaxID=2690964 RepID=A0A6I4VU56_9BACL|nr:RNA-binding S4 domain-containing protein [Shimazuella alba]MXQ54533.1 RNA-binding S4 domain-containing protein [Shimazuella alba]
MRLDKFLKVSRMIKRRTLAKEVCDGGRVSINDKVAKAGSEVKAGDILTIRFGQKLVTAKIERIADNVSKDMADTLYTIVKEEAVH